jgi:hypothetical protein
MRRREEIMSNHHSESIEFSGRSNVRLVTDEHGEKWTCWDRVEEGRGLGDQSCQQTDDVTYDRGFGG